MPHIRSSGLSLKAQLGILSRNGRCGSSAGTFLYFRMSWLIAFVNFVAQAAQKEANMSQFDFTRVGGGAV